MAHTGDHGENTLDLGGDHMHMKTLARRAAALVMTIGLAVGLSGVTSAANASEDTGWGRIAPSETIHD